MEIITQQLVQEILQPRKLEANKSDFGHALIVAGSKGKIGAAVLAAKACLRSGVGLLTVHVPDCGEQIMQISIPEAMVSIDADNSVFTDELEIGKYSIVAFGPGLGTNKNTQAAVKKLLTNHLTPMVIDADGLNCLSLNKELLPMIPENSILTPHPLEFERLVGKWETLEQKLEKQCHFSKTYNCFVVLKGNQTTISSPEGKLYKNTTGNPGMAKGGSGDALTGIITAFVSQGYSSEESSILGVYLHGLAGDLAAIEKTEFSLLPSDLIEFLPQAFKIVD
jgi:NAD(P)H-hydrate epimerase